jgi:hypothetical protein
MEYIPAENNALRTASVPPMRVLMRGKAERNTPIEG